MQKSLYTAALAALLAGGLAPAVGAQITSVAADVTGAVTWCDDEDTIILEQPIFVKDGGVLTINPGCIIRGQPRTQGVVVGQQAGTPGALIVTQTGTIIANGNAANPIIMTTAATDNNGDGVADTGQVPGNFKSPWDPGDLFLDADPATSALSPLDASGEANVSLWGGLVLLGEAPTNLDDGSGVGYGRATIEGLTIPGFLPADATYGGEKPHDSSGVLRYVSVRHAGDQIGANNELNGISLGGVGDGTVFENIEVYCNFDDGIEWFGGTVNGKNLVVAFAGDDTFDLDQGYTGVNQFLFGIMPFFNENDNVVTLEGNPPVATDSDPFGSGSGDRGGEFDGDDFDETPPNVNQRLPEDEDPINSTPWPMPAPLIVNMTLIGSTLEAGAEFTPAGDRLAMRNRGIFLRHGFAGNIYNSILMNTGTRKAFEIDTDTGESLPGFDTIDNVNNGLIALVSSTLFASAAPGAAENTAIANGDAIATQANGANSINPPATDFGLRNSDISFDPTGAGSGLLDPANQVPDVKANPVNPRPTGLDANVLGAFDVPGPGLQTVSYRGAFGPSIFAPLWTTGWTAINLGGIVGN